MRAKIVQVLIFFLWTSNPVVSKKSDRIDIEDYHSVQPPLKSTKHKLDIIEVQEKSCLDIQPTAKDIIRRVYAVLPFFDKDNTNTKFLNNFRSTLNSLAVGQDPLDREAALYVSLATPALFLQHHRDIWCFVEKYHKALLVYKELDQSDKRYALKILQKLKNIALSLQKFIKELPEIKKSNITFTTKSYDEDLIEESDVKYFKELLKNLG